MKIKRISIWKENLELTKPYTIAYETIDAVENVFVSLEAENGVIGMCAASPSPEVTGESIRLCQESLAQYGETVLKNSDIRTYKSLLKQLGQNMKTDPAALPAIDIALHELTAQLLKMELFIPNVGFTSSFPGGVIDVVKKS